MATEWYMQKDGRKHGPISGRKLRQLASTGKIKPEDLIQKKGMTEWQPAKNLTGLFPKQSKVTPPPLPLNRNKIEKKNNSPAHTKTELQEAIIKLVIDDHSSVPKIECVTNFRVQHAHLQGELESSQQRVEELGRARLEYSSLVKQHHEAKQQVATSRTQLLQLAHLLGSSAFDVFTKGNIEKHPSFVPRIESQDYVKSLQNEYDIHIPVVSETILEKTSSKAQQMIIAGKIKIEELKYSKLETQIGKYLIEANEEKSVRCEDTRDVLSQIKKIRTDIVQHEQLCNTAFDTLENKKKEFCENLSLDEIRSSRIFNTELSRYQKKVTNLQKEIVTLISKIIVKLQRKKNMVPGRLAILLTEMKDVQSQHLQTPFSTEPDLTENLLGNKDIQPKNNKKYHIVFGVLLFVFFAVKGAVELQHEFLDNSDNKSVSNKELLDPTRENLHENPENISVKEPIKKWGFIDNTGKVIIPFEYEESKAFSEGLAAVKKNGKWGFIDNTGKVVITFQFSDVWSFSEGLAFVYQDNDIFCIDRGGNSMFQLPKKLRISSEFKNGRAIVSNDDFIVDEDYSPVDGTGLTGVIDQEGKIIVNPQFRLVGQFAEERAVVISSSKRAGSWYGIIDIDGNYIVPLSKELIIDKGYSEGLVAFEMRKDKFIVKSGFLDKNGKVSLVCPQGISPVTRFYNYGYSEGLAPFLRSISKEESYVSFRRTKMGLPAQMPEGFGNYGYMDRFGKIVVAPQFNVISKFSGGLAAVNKGEKWGIIDKTGRVVIPFDYEEAKVISEGLTAVKKDEKWGIIDKTGRVVIPFEYEEAKAFSGGISAVKRDEKWGIIDKTGKVVTEFQFTDIGLSFSEGLVNVSQ